MTVLLVEDEALVRELVRSFLEHGGYQVVEASGAEAAIAAAATHGDAIELLVSDVLLPGTNGVKLARQLRGIVPSLKVLYVSGHPGDSIPSDAISEPGTGFLSKPFTRRVLLDKIHALIDRRTRP